MSDSNSWAMKQIDDTLRLVGGVMPRAGFEQRVLTSVELGSHAGAAGRGRWWRFLALGRWNFGVKTAGLLVAGGAAVLLVGGAVHKSRGVTPAVQPSSSVVQPRPATGGFGPAAIGHLPDNGLTVEHENAQGRGRRRPQAGRAVLPSSPIRRGDGSAVSSSPYRLGRRSGTAGTPAAGAQDVSPR